MLAKTLIWPAMLPSAACRASWVARSASRNSLTSTKMVSTPDTWPCASVMAALITQGLAPHRIGMQHLGFKERLPAFGKQFSGVQPLNLRFICRQQIRQ